MNYPHDQACTCKGCELTRIYCKIDIEHSIASDAIYRYFLDLVKQALVNNDPSQARAIVTAIPDTVTKVLCMDQIRQYEKKHPQAEVGKEAQ